MKRSTLENSPSSWLTFPSIAYGRDEDRPTFAELGTIAERWHPYRAVAARILWHDYLQRRGLPV